MPDLQHAHLIEKQQQLRLQHPLQAPCKASKLERMQWLRVRDGHFCPVCKVNAEAQLMTACLEGPGIDPSALSSACPENVHLLLNDTVHGHQAR